jgi:hypothetical protein
MRYGEWAVTCYQETAADSRLLAAVLAIAYAAKIWYLDDQLMLI